MINIAELLKDAPTGMKLYSPLFGEVEFAEVMDTDYVPIRVMCGVIGERFDEFGRYKGNEYPNAECLLFPSKNCRTWEGWKVPAEPKFQVGEWIVQNDNGTVSQITKIINGKDEYGEYRAYEHTNGYFHTCFENEYHLWTIKDAKDGDVLATDNGWTCIFKAFDGCVFSSYCFMDSQKWFCEFGSEGHTLDNKINGNIHPATKEQRTLLFKKMQEAGYQWYAGKKELKKIIEPKFKVGDSLQSGSMWAMVRRIDTENQRYICQFDNVIPFEEQDRWNFVPNPKKHYAIANFHAGMPVLVRETSLNAWQYVLFSHCYIGGDGLTRFNAGLVGFTQCIPFNDDTKHLLGTTDKPSDEYINW